MNGDEFLKKLKKYSKLHGLNITLKKNHGKGSHATLYYNDKRTTLKDRKKEIGEGLLSEMLKDLGIKKKEFK